MRWLSQSWWSHSYAKRDSATMSSTALAVEEVAMHIEQPFGNDDDDLPIEAYCLSLEADLLSMLDEENL